MNYFIVYGEDGGTLYETQVFDYKRYLKEWEEGGYRITQIKASDANRLKKTYRLNSLYDGNVTQSGGNEPYIPESETIKPYERAKRITKNEKAQAAIAENLESRKAVGEAYDSTKMPVLAARKFNHAGKTFDVVLSRFNSHIKGKYIYSIITRERGAITGGFEVRKENEKDGRAEFMRVDTSYL